jgi:hypothetical protein
MKLFILKSKYNLVWYFEEIRQEYYTEEIRQEYYTRWNNTVMDKEATFRIVR